jgi:hypothetical protein
MADQRFEPLHLRSDDDLGAALRAMGSEIAWPAPAAPASGEPDIAALVRARLVSDAAGTGPGAPDRRAPALPRWHWAPARRALVLALIALLVLAAIAGAAGLGLPGLRIIFGGPSAAPPAPSSSAGPSASPASSAPESTPDASGTAGAGPPGSGLGLGSTVDLDRLDEQAGFTVKMPADPSIGPPDAAWVNPALNDQVSLVWTSSARLPDTHEPGVGLILTAFRGTVSDGWFTKAIGPGTTFERVRVGGQIGYWVTGDPHQFFYEGPTGFVEESRRWVGDVLLWADGTITYRLETSLGRDAAIAIAESMD